MSFLLLSIECLERNWGLVCSDGPGRWAVSQFRSSVLGSRVFQQLYWEYGTTLSAGCLGGWQVPCCVQTAAAPLVQTTHGLGLASPEIFLSCGRLPCPVTSICPESGQELEQRGCFDKTATLLSAPLIPEDHVFSPAEQCSPGTGCRDVVASPPLRSSASTWMRP